MPSVKAAEAAAATLKRLYGSAVAIQYHDIGNSSQHKDTVELLATFTEEGWSLPVTLLDGKLLFVGGLQPAKLVAEVARELVRRNPEMMEGTRAQVNR